MSELQLQAKIVINYRNFGQRGETPYKTTVWGNFSELLKSSMGSKLLASGLIKNLPDLMASYNNKVYGLELKEKGSGHKTQHLIEQGQWMRANLTDGWFVDSEEMFYRILDGIEGRGAWVDSNIEQVVKECEKHKAMSIKWDNIFGG